MNNLRRVRLLIGLTRNQLSDLADIHPGALFNLETCRRKGRGDTKKKLSSALFVDQSILFPRERDSGICLPED